MPGGNPALPAAVGVDSGVGQHHAYCWEKVGEEEGEREDVEVDAVDSEEVHEPGRRRGTRYSRGESGNEEEGGDDGCEAEVLEEKANKADAGGISAVQAT